MQNTLPVASFCSIINPHSNLEVGMRIPFYRGCNGFTLPDPSNTGFMGFCQWDYMSITAWEHSPMLKKCSSFLSFHLLLFPRNQYIKIF